jgi:drug/metabolite transporter (DMT)-like permease
MPVLLAYISLILLWSTTPLAIQWSTREVGFLFGAVGRMSIGLVCISVILILSRQSLIISKRALLNYLAVAMQLYGSMLLVCWAAQFVPSGWISLVFGLVPLMTAVIAAVVLKEHSLSFGKIFSYLMGLSGLGLMLHSAFEVGTNAVWAIAALLVAAFFQVISSVWIKRLNDHIPAFVQVAGGLLLAVPAYLLTWWLVDGAWPVKIPKNTLGAIAYLGIVATTFGFSLYYFILQHLSATRVALITLMSPMLALLLGHFANNEPLTLHIIQGAALILSALLVHEWAEFRLRRLVV